MAANSCQKVVNMTRRKLFGIIPLPLLKLAEEPRNWSVTVEAGDGVQYQRKDAFARFDCLKEEEGPERILRLYQGGKLKQVVRVLAGE